MAKAVELYLRRAEPGAVTEDQDGKLKYVVDVDHPSGRAMLAEIELTEDTPFSAKFSYNHNGKWQYLEDRVDEQGKKVKVQNPDGTTSRRNVKDLVVVEDRQRFRRNPGGASGASPCCAPCCRSATG